MNFLSGQDDFLRGQDDFTRTANQPISVRHLSQPYNKNMYDVNITRHKTDRVQSIQLATE